MKSEEYTWWNYLYHLMLLLRPQRRVLVMIFLLLLLQLAFALLFPLGLQMIFDRAIPQKDMGYLVLVLGGIGCGFLVSTVAMTQVERLASKVGAQCMKWLRIDMFQHLQRLPFGYYQRTAKGELLSRFSNDLSSIEQIVTRGFSLFVLNVLLLVTSVLLLFVVEWRLALLTLLVSPILLSGPSLLGKRSNDLSYQRKQRDDELSVLLQEQVDGYQTIRTYGLDGYMQKRYQESTSRWTETTAGMHFSTGLSGVISYSGVMFLILLIVSVGSWLALRGSFSIGGLVAFVGLLLNVDEASRGLNLIWPPLLQSQSGMQRIQELMAEPSIETPAAPAPSPASDIIGFNDVTFGYDASHPILKQLSFSIPLGHSVAFVGRSGSGKSTVLQLMMRAYDLQQGSILWGERDVREVELASFYSKIGVVFQHTFLFNASLRENIRLGRTTASNDEVEEVSRRVDLHDFVLSLPEGYDTRVGEAGLTLSGGQRQRIAIARALLRTPDLLILDEATSALDPATETQINQTLQVLTKGRTAVTVTHRLASVVAMDEIFVMEQGRLVERGTHQELLAHNGSYSELWRKQSGFTLEEDGTSARVDALRLKQIPLLEALTPEQLELIAQRFETEQFSPGQTMIEQGTQGKKFYILIRGTAQVVLCHEEYEEPVNSLEIGDYFGEIALLADTKTTAMVRTRTACTCLSLTRGQFQNLLQEYPELYRSIEPLMQMRQEQIQEFREKRIQLQ